MAYQVEEKTFSLNGYRLNYKVSGSGFPLVLIHTHHPYAKYFLESLPKGQKSQVLTINIPGYYSSRQKKAVDTIDKFLSLLDQLFDHLQFSRVDLIGECLGSVIVLKFAAKYPAKTRKVIAVSPPLRIFDLALRETVGPSLAFLRRNQIAGTIAKLILRLNLWKQITDFLGGYQEFWAIFKQETLLVSQYNFDQRVFWGILADLWQTDMKKVFQSLKSETLFVVGKKDRLSKIKEIEKICLEKKNRSYKVVRGANHAIVVSHTREFNQIVKNFLYKP